MVTALRPKPAVLVIKFLPRFTWEIPMTETSTMSSKGQVVVPKRVREALQANNGARIGFELKGDKAVMFVVRKKTAKPEDGYGLAKGKGRKVALDGVRQIVAVVSGIQGLPATTRRQLGRCIREAAR